MSELECPKRACFFYIPPGGAADMSGQRYKNVLEAFKKGKWKRFPDGGCSCLQPCVRIDPTAKDDYFEPLD
jgi:hypothetical protein